MTINIIEECERHMAQLAEERAGDADTLRGDMLEALGRRLPVLIPDGMDMDAGDFYDWNRATRIDAHYRSGSFVLPLTVNGEYIMQGGRYPVATVWMLPSPHTSIRLHLSEINKAGDWISTAAFGAVLDAYRDGLVLR